MRVDQLVLATCAWLLTYVVHSTVLIGFAWATSALLERFGRSASWLAVVRERLWKLALVGGLATATVQTVLGIGPWNLGADLEGARPAAGIEPLTTLPVSQTLPAGEPVPMLIPAVWVPIAHRLVASGAGTETHAPSALSRSAEQAPGATQGSSGNMSSSASRSSGANNSSGASKSSGASSNALTVPPFLLRAILGAWAVGVLFGLVRWASDWRRLLAALDCRVRIVSGLAHDVFRGLVRRAGVGGHVHLYSAPRIGAPITLGFAQPAICLPPRAETELQRDELEALLAHELAHALRRDPAWLCACRVIEVLFFFQPLNRVARVHLADEAEYLCDDWAVRHTRERLPLASCLTEIASWIVGHERELPMPGMAARGSRLELRVRRLLDARDRSANEAPRWMSPLAWSAVAAVAFFVPGVSAKGRAEVETGPLAQDARPGDADSAPRSERLELAQEDAGFDESADDPEAGDESPDAMADASDDESQPGLGSDEEPTRPCPMDEVAAEPGPASDVVTCTKQPAAKGECTTQAAAKGACTTQPAANSACTTKVPECSTSVACAPEAPDCPAPVACAPQPAASAPLAISSTTPTVWSINGPFSFSVPLSGMLALDPHAMELQPGATLLGHAISLDDARALRAEITTLEETFKALKQEIGQRRASTEFKTRITSLEHDLKVLRQQHSQLSILLNLPGSKIDAPRSAPKKDQPNNKDRK